ncbi:DUF4194 domain-containing protein [Ruania alkalisoli]|uniref:DUF4194 domain-containing protein n=1 Tax=Ruania alkalisoli TaxID=2779775 RepID=A0A7M1SNN4_9MICO|nr:DUF4194 domain-containing protein [Ruania alkalisoli]QOR69186.1 DUF4194 domain-containing protein [Ruania alkalisoli]
MTEGTVDLVAPEGRLWSEDLGTLAEQSRRALLEIVRGPYLSGQRRPVLWAALIADEHAIRSRLHDLFLDLVIDRVDEFAFARKVRTTEIDVPSPMRTESLNFLDTAMLLVLRQLLLASPGESRVIVGQDEVYERLMVYRTGDEKTFRGNLNGAWGRMANRFRVIHVVEEDRAEISPVLKFILDHDRVRALTEQFQNIAAGATSAATSEGEQ